VTLPVQSSAAPGGVTSPLQSRAPPVPRMLAADGAFTPTARDERAPEFVIVSSTDLTGAVNDHEQILSSTRWSLLICFRCSYRT
jgi:hypothetical protein